VTLLWSWGAAAKPTAAPWRRLQPGLHYLAIPVTSPAGIKVSDPHLHVVQVVPSVAVLRVGLASQRDKRPRPVAEWGKALGLAVTTNLGMYYGNNLTHVGYLRSGEHINSARWLPRYESLLVLRPKSAFLLDRGGWDDRVLKGADVLVQNLRLIRSRDNRRGENAWRPQDKRWSEAALAMDCQGNLLFLFCRAPLSMWEFNQLILRLPLCVVRAMHLEGGPEASLSIHAGGVDLDLSGSFETGFFTSDLNHEQWPVPNVLGVIRR
jgi:hypothetical protein